MMEILKHSVLSNYRSKLIAVLIGTLLWYHFSNQVKETRTIEVQPVVSLEDTKSYWTLTEDLNKLRKIRIEGPKTVLDEFSEKGPRMATIQVSTRELKGKKPFPIVISHKITGTDIYGLPSELKVVGEPVQLDIEIDETADQPLEIVVAKKNKNDDWQYTPTQKTVTVRGPQTKLKEMKSVKTLEVTHEDVKEQQKIPFEIIKFGGRPFEYSPESTTINATRQVEMADWDFKNVRIDIQTSESFMGKYKVSLNKGPTMELLTLRLPKDEQIKSDNIVVVVHLEESDVSNTTAPQDVEGEVRIEKGNEVRILEKPRPVVSVNITSREGS